MDWDAIKQEYISTNISQRELAEKYGVSVSSLGKKCASEGWSGLRKKFRKKVEKKTMEKISRKKACELAKIGACADKLVRLIDDSLNDTATVRQTIVKLCRAKTMRTKRKSRNIACKNSTLNICGK